VLAFGGRLLSGDGPKYINSPDTLVFKKQENLFGIDKALAAIKKQNMALVCEGYMDVISFHIAGMDFAVAPLGTAFTSRQAQLLRRRSEKVILCFDSDSAGQKAAERACVIAVTAGLQADVIIPPNGKDASEILEKSGVEALKNILEYSINSGEFLIRRAEELFDLGTLDGKSRASSFFYPYLDALESEVKRNSFLEVLGRRMGINPTALLADYQKAKTGIGYRVAAGGTFSPAQSSKTALIARTVDLVCMSAILLSPGSFSKLSGKLDIEDFDDPRARDIYAILEESLRAGVVDTSALLPLLSDDTLRRFIISMAASGELDENLDAVINDGIKRIRMRSLERKRIRLTLEIGRASQNASMESENKERLVELLTQKMSLDNEISLIKGDLDE
jgi:DNA primase